MSLLTERAQNFAEIQQYLVSSALDLFNLYGMPIEYSPGGAAEVKTSAVMAIIGYASPDVRGSLLLLTSRSVVLGLKPSEVQSVPDEEVLRDVLGEFANMLLGRVKNQLSARKVEPLISTPTTVFGDYVVLPVPTSGVSAWHTFESKRGPIFARFDATFELGFSLAPAVEGKPPLAEGEVLFFGEPGDET